MPSKNGAIWNGSNIGSSGYTIYNGSNAQSLHKDLAQNGASQRTRLRHCEIIQWGGASVKKIPMHNQRSYKNYKAYNDIHNNESWLADPTNRTDRT